MFPSDTLFTEPVERVVDLMRATFNTGQFRAIYNGDPGLIPASNLPALCVVQLRDTNTPDLSSHDRVEVSMQIRVVLDHRPDWKITDDKKDLTDSKIRQIVEARDKTTQQYLPDTLKGVLRRRKFGDGFLLARDMTFELATLERPDDVITREGRLTFSFSYDVPLPDPDA